MVVTELSTALPYSPRRGIQRKEECMPKKMKAAVVHKFGQPLVIDELAVPEPKEGQALVKIEASGVCHTDLHAADGDWPLRPTPPFIPGHEGAGVVAALGSGVKHVKEGDRVGIAWLHSACGHCEFCLSGWETLCLQQQNSGYSVNGSFAEYAVADADYLGRIPANLLYSGRANFVRRRYDLQRSEGNAGSPRRMGGHHR